MVHRINKPILDSYRVRYNETQGDLAEAMGTDGTALSMKLNGRRKLSLYEAAFIVARYDIPDEDAVKIFLR